MEGRAWVWYHGPAGIDEADPHLCQYPEEPA